MGPIQPILVTDGKVEYTHDRPDIEDFAVPVEVMVGPQGQILNVVVSESTGNLEADAVAVSFMRDRKFLPGLDAAGNTTDSSVKVVVNMYKRGPKKVARVTIKPPPMAQETLRLHTLMCADFLWEVERMDKQAKVDDLSLEVMPYTSARLYMAERRVPDDLEAKFWDEWPSALKKVVDRCEKDQTKLFFSEILLPTLDGVMPPEFATAAAQ
jgi:TonB family protein